MDSYFSIFAFQLMGYILSCFHKFLFFGDVFVFRSKKEVLEPEIKIKKIRVKAKKEEVLEKPVAETEKGQQEDLEPEIKIKKIRVKAKKEEVSVLSTKRKVYDYNMRRDWALAYAKYKQMYFSVWWKNDQDFINELFAKPSEAEQSPL